MREVVMSLTCERFLQSMTQTLRQMFGRRADRELVIFTAREIHNPRQRIDGFGPCCFVPQQFFDLFLVRHIERPIEIHETARCATPHLEARRANDRSRGGVFLLHRNWLGGTLPATVDVHRFAFLANSGFSHGASAAVTPRVMVNTFGKRRIVVSFPATHKITPKSAGSSRISAD